MNEADLRSLRREVRRNEDISNGAARLFSEVIDLHMLEEGCFAHDPTLADWLGTTPRTVRRWRKELTSAGYLREEPADRGRHLIPHKADPDKNDRTKMSDRTDMSGQNCPPADKNVHDDPDKNVQHREINIPQAEGPGEGAPAPTHDPSTRTSSKNGEAEAPDSIDPVVESENTVNAITEAAFGEPVRGLAVKEQIRTYCERAGPEGWDCLRSACHLINEKGWNPTSQLVKKKLWQQLQILRETDEHERPDDFASKAASIHEAARRGAGLDG
jgi:hypothetical protein